jgi:hypothetical protein
MAGAIMAVPADKASDYDNLPIDITSFHEILRRTFVYNASGI